MDKEPTKYDRQKEYAKKLADSLKVGDFYEDCFYHPCVVTKIHLDTDTIEGISLVDGSAPRGCSLYHCGVVKLTPAKAIFQKFYGPSDPDVVADFKEDKKWWLSTRR